MLATSDFSRKVMELINKIPKGKVATYGQIAKLAGKPHGSRGVSWILHSCSVTYRLPWHRVVNSKGKISFLPLSHNYRQQKRYLENEKVIFLHGDRIDLLRFQWKKTAPKPRSIKGKPQIFG